MTREEYNTLHLIAADKPWLVSMKLKMFIENATIEEDEEKPRGNRTLQQNKAIWKFFSLVADKLTELGVTMRVIFRETDTFDIPPTKDSVHDLWVHFQKAMVGTERTRDLRKDQIDRIHEVFMKNMGEKFHLEYIPFPSDNEKQMENLRGIRLEATSHLDR